MQYHEIDNSGIDVYFVYHYRQTICRLLPLTQKPARCAYQGSAGRQIPGSAIIGVRLSRILSMSLLTIYTVYRGVLHLILSRLRLS